MKKQILTGALLTSALLLSTTASAAYQTFRGEDLNNDPDIPLVSLPNAAGAETTFKSNLSSSVSTETFESKAAGAVAPLTLDFLNTVTNVVTSATLLGGGQVSSVPPGTTNGVGRYSIPSATSSKFWEVDASNFTINFTSAVAAFGFYGIDIGDFGGSVSIDLLGAGNAVLGTVNLGATVGNNGSTDGSVIYFGVLSDGAASDFTGLTFKIAGAGGDVFAFDNFTIATRDQVEPPPDGVPLPGTLLLAGLGLVGLGAARRRQR